MSNDRNLGKNGFVTNVMPLIGSVYSNDIIGYNTSISHSNSYIKVYDSILEEDVIKTFFGLNPSDTKKFNFAYRNSLSGAVQDDLNIPYGFKWSMDLLFRNKNSDRLKTYSNSEIIDDFFTNNEQGFNHNWWGNRHNTEWDIISDDGGVMDQYLSSTGVLVYDDFPDIPLSYFSRLNCVSLLNHNFNQFREVGVTIKILAFSKENKKFFVHEVGLDELDPVHGSMTLGKSSYIDLFNSQSSTRNITSITREDNMMNINKNSGSTITAWSENSSMLYDDAIVCSLSAIFHHTPEEEIPTILNRYLNIGSIGFGSYYTMPVAADVGFSKSIEFDNIKSSETLSGRSLFSIKNSTPDFLLSYNSSVNSQKRRLIDRKGRRRYNLEFQGILDTDLFPRSESGDYSIPTDFTLGDNFSSYTHLDNSLFKENKMTIYHALVYDSMGGQVPFIFIENTLDLNAFGCIRQDNFTQCILDSDTIEVTSLAPNFYSISLDLREVW